MALSRHAARAMWFAGGFGFGAALGIMLAPKPGADTRKAIGESGREYYERGRELYERGLHMADDAAEMYEEGRRLVEETAAAAEA